MKTLVTGALLLALAFLPFDLPSQETPTSPTSPTPDKQLGLPAIIVGAVAVCVAGVACYVVVRVTKKHNEATLCKNDKCQKPVPLDAEWCPACGTYFRCRECGTEFPKDAKKCPATWCEALRPPPEPVPNKLQYTQPRSPNPTKLSGHSAVDGVGNVSWRDVTVPHNVTFASGPHVIYMATQAEFDAYVSDPDVLYYVQISTNAQSGFFRIAGQ